MVIYYQDFEVNLLNIENGNLLRLEVNLLNIANGNLLLRL